MNIEEAIEILENSKKLYLKEKIDSDILEEAIETLLTAYEKGKEKNKKLQDKYKELIFEKQELTSALLDSIPKDKLKEIVDECIPKKENIITRELEYTPNANANSYLTQEILSLLEKE